jgi:hypothetical protein
VSAPAGRRQLGHHGVVGLGDGGPEVLTQARPEQGERGGGEPGLHHRPLVGEVEHDRLVGGAGHGGGGVRGDGQGRLPSPNLPEQGEDLGRRPRPGDGEQPVVAAPAGHLGGGEGVRLAPAPGLPERRVGLGHEPGGPAAHDRDPFTVPRQQALGPRGDLDGTPPAVRLRDQLGMDERLPIHAT